MNNYNTIPVGLGMALAKDSKAMEYFASLSDEQKSNIINYTHNIGSKDEMMKYVKSLYENNLS